MDWHLSKQLHALNAQVFGYTIAGNVGAAVVSLCVALSAFGAANGSLIGGTLALVDAFSETPVSTLGTIASTTSV